MQLASWLIFFVVLLSCYAPSQQDSIQPTSLHISANEEGSFTCSFNDSNKTLPISIFWFFDGSIVYIFPISTQEFLKIAIDENGVTTISSTITFVIDPKSANVFNNTEVQCVGFVITEDVVVQYSLTAKLYVQGILSAPSGVLVHFLSDTMYTQWTHPSKYDPSDTIAYHINITYKSNYSALVNGMTKNNSSCILYEVCVREETLAGVGYPGCVNTSSNISILEAFDFTIPSLSVLNHTNTSPSILENENTLSCSPTGFSIHADGEFHNANVSVRNSTNSLVLELPALHNTVLESDSITLELNLSKPDIALSSSIVEIPMMTFSTSVMTFSTSVMTPSNLSIWTGPLLISLLVIDCIYITLCLCCVSCTAGCCIRRKYSSSRSIKLSLNNAELPTSHVPELLKGKEFVHCTEINTIEETTV